MNELWRVQLGTGEVRMMTIDELDRAFDAGFIHSRTNVLAPGSFKWTTLGEAAGLEDEQPAYVEQTPSLSPMAIAGGASNYSLPQMPAYQPYNMSSFGLDDDDMYPKRSKKGIVAGFMIAAVVGAAAFLFSTGKIHSLQTALAGTHAAEAKAASATLAPAAEQKLPEAAKPAEEPKPAETTPPAGKMTDDMKKKLLDADKDRDAKLKAKAEKAGKGVRRRLKGAAPADGDTSQPKPEGHKLIEGGDKFDPLNSSI
jgi:hypothetical protein